MSEIKIYNQEMYVRMTDVPAEVQLWCHRLVGATEEHMFWKSGAYNFWTINDRKAVRAALDSAPKPSPPVRKRLGAVPKPSPPVRRKLGNKVKPSPTPRPVRRD